MKNKKLPIIIAIVTLSIIGIAVIKLNNKETKPESTETNQASQQSQQDQQDFYFNKDTQKDAYESPVKLETNSVTDGTDKQNNEHIGEIELVNDDTSVTYSIIDNKSVKYNNTTYQDLYACINNINSKYSANTIINFIIKTHKSASDLVYVDVITDDVNTSEGDSIDLTLDEELQGYNQYESIKSKYNNEPVTWKLTLTDSETMYPTYIYGCDTYMLMTGTNGDIQIDMSAYDSGLNIYHSDQSEPSDQSETTDQPEPSDQSETTEEQTNQSEDQSTEQPEPLTEQ